MDKKIEEIIESLSPLERKIIPLLDLPIEEIEKKSGLDKTSVLRALKFLENKGIVRTSTEQKIFIDLGTNGIYYKKNHLPERRLITTLEKNNHLQFQEAKKISSLSDNEFKVSLGVLKEKNFISIINGKISLTAPKSELSNKTPEEKLLEKLPKEESELSEEEKKALTNLKKRKEIVETKQKSKVSFQLTETGKKLAGQEVKTDLIEEVTPEVIKNWTRNKKFRRYDITSQTPPVYGGKKHFVNQAIEYGKQIWIDLGFKEMIGNKVETSFWNFDALFTAQDHPVREMQDTFFLNTEGKLPEKKIVEKVKKSHESGVDKSEGWKYNWKEDEAKSVVLRTHTTGLSARALATLKKSDLPIKLFAIGKVFRNETVDWSHGFEFYQSEGIVVDESVTFRDLLGYLKEFYRKMGFEDIRFSPAYFPYTEPSVEVHVFHPQKKVWVELGGAGIFRPEVIVPLFGEYIPVLAWGQGFDRIITDYYKISDLRQMYSNDIKELREKPIWIK